MNQTPAAGRSGAHYSSAESGPFAELGRYTLKHPRIEREVEGKLFLKEALGLTGMEVSLNKLPPRAFMPFYHRHQENEELYVFIKGQGEFQVDGEIFPVQEGSVVRVAPEGSRAWRNTSESEPLYYLVIQAKAGTMPMGTISDGVGVEGRVRWRR